jgi:hypothetical protein
LIYIVPEALNLMIIYFKIYLYLKKSKVTKIQERWQTGENGSQEQKENQTEAGAGTFTFLMVELYFLYTQNQVKRKGCSPTNFFLVFLLPAFYFTSPYLHLTSKVIFLRASLTLISMKKKKGRKEMYK